MQTQNFGYVLLMVMILITTSCKKENPNLKGEVIIEDNSIHIWHMGNGLPPPQRSGFSIINFNIKNRLIEERSINDLKFKSIKLKEVFIQPVTDSELILADIIDDLRIVVKRNNEEDYVLSLKKDIPRNPVEPIVFVMDLDIMSVINNDFEIEDIIEMDYNVIKLTGEDWRFKYWYKFSYELEK